MSYDQIGFAPVYQDASGAMFVDPDGVEVGGSEESGFLALGNPQRRLGRMQNRIARLQGREAELSQRLGGNAQQPETGPTVYNADLRALAAQKGLIVENQFNGLGFTNVVASGTGQLTDNMNRDCWIKSMVLSSDVTAVTAVTSITIAGIPINIGSKSMPMEAFARDSVRFGISFGRRLVRSGQGVNIGLQNISAATAINVQGGLICDEMASYLVQGVAEAGLLAAVNGSGCGSY